MKAVHRHFHLRLRVQRRAAPLSDEMGVNCGRVGANATFTLIGVAEAMTVTLGSETPPVATSVSVVKWASELVSKRCHQDLQGIRSGTN